ncbi:BppU family phage baseplate upper protein [Metabacillus idriensis]|uniref:BppU family phage baseplate upper protein n=1 Tax=Metabacillus idriensis TaxID=324768 RepID=UPI001749BCDF|nr:BppU family phage baseplate upper protein [Metabacillus idriensis]
MIHVGDNGVPFELTIKEKGVPIDIRGASIVIAFKVGQRLFQKIAQVTDGENGLCSTDLTDLDLSTAGYYEYQAKVMFDSPTRKNHTSTGSFPVESII